MAQLTQSFLDKLIDWKEFEFFVADIYKDSDKVLVEHDVTELGKPGAKRQIDVKITQTTKLHTIVTIVECKRWKKKVTRQVIDVLAASVEDLNCNKGVIFTTKGYESGAIKYAQNKNIDIFLVRDIREDEWGEPGRNFALYLQMFKGKLGNFRVNKPKFFSPLGLQPNSPFQGFSIAFSKDQKYPESQQLVTLDGKKGPNLVKVLIDVRSTILKQFLDSFHHLLQPEQESPELAFKSEITIDFKEYAFKFIRHDNGFIVLDSITFNLYQAIHQSKMEFDRTANIDFGLIVENYITKQRNFVSKKKEEETIILSNPVIDKEHSSESEVVKNGSIIKLTLEHYVSFELKDSTEIKETNSATVKLKSN